MWMENIVAGYEMVTCYEFPFPSHRIAFKANKGLIYIIKIFMGSTYNVKIIMGNILFILLFFYQSLHFTHHFLIMKGCIYQD